MKDDNSRPGRFVGPGVRRVRDGLGKETSRADTMVKRRCQLCKHSDLECRCLPVSKEEKKKQQEREMLAASASEPSS